MVEMKQGQRDEAPKTGRRKLVAMVLCPLLFLMFVEFGGRLKYDNTAYIPGEATLRVQALLQSHPRIGYLWQGGIAKQGFPMDRPPDKLEPLYTDVDGFRNDPLSITARRDGQAIDVLALGDSFTHDAALVFSEAFRREGLLYYNMAMKRHCIAQFNLILEEYGLAAKPRSIFYGIYEHNMGWVRDFEKWQASGLDWFEYHSGTYCGPSIDEFGWGRHLPGLYAVWRATSGRFREWPKYDRAWHEKEAEKILAHTLEAKALADEAGITFLPVLIPRKDTAIKGLVPEAPLTRWMFDRLLKLFEERGVRSYDLRPTFINHENPRSLYYVDDGHWNEQGMRLAAPLILEEFR